MDRKAKYLHVREHGHLFGDKHNCYFNPYSYSPVNEEICKRIEKPEGFQVGRGGPNSKPIHEVIGLRGDYDFRLDIATSTRKALLLFKPQKLTLNPGQNLTYAHYGSSSRTNIYNYMLDRFRFLYHFRDQSGENNWAIDAFCISSLASNSSYAKTSNGKANLYLKRNESGPRGTNRNNDDDNRASLDGYEDDYALNARARRNAPPSAPSSHSTAANERPRTAEPNSCRNYDNNPCPQKKQCKSPRECSSSPVSLPPEPTSAELRRAAQVVASEEARNKALGASKDKAGAKPAAAPKGKERKNGSVPSRSKRDHVEVDDEELDDEPKLVSKKVDRRGPPTLCDDEPTPKSGSARQNKSAPKNTGKKAKGAAKSARRQEQSPPPDDSEQEQRSQKEVRRPVSGYLAADPELTPS
ncbi:unnamed protein product [Rhizoctonia solani]|uniref:Uncharacterized protein n=1 Tax=Rhizoctonia solani TaxID=456999 RepID=A0A8H3GLK8_9AGAM|nr:unnamed protein product [Rhizoctonia solani]